MRLISLTANKKSFKAIKFNPSGVSLIVGKQKNPEKSDFGKTYNGVGKSLTIALIHFCLGSSKNSEFESAIPGWEFTLWFEIDEVKYYSTRGTSTQDKIILNGEQMSPTDFRERLESKLFAIHSPIPDLKFRPLISRFIRQRKDGYVSFDAISSKETPYAKLLCNSFLLGLEVNLVIDKYKLKEKKDKIKSIKKSLTKDPIFITFFTGNKNVEIELKDLRDKIKQLENDLKEFQVAENYYEVQKQANSIKNTLQAKKNRAVIISNAIANIDKSLQVRPDVPPDKIFKLYDEAKAKLPEAVVKSISQVYEFHEKLILNRIKRLSNEKSNLEQELKEINKDITSLSELFDSKLKFLGSHGALDDFVQLTNSLSELKANAQKLEDYKGLLDKYSNETQEINIALSNENKRATNYLKDVSRLIDQNLETFRSFSRKFYNDKPGGLTVTNNEGENQTRFDIDARIQDDASEGINDVKIFCFDMTILKSHHNHKINFLFHDSRLFSDIDPRQRATLFKIAYEYTQDGNTQYIATVNEDQIESVRDKMVQEEFNKIIQDNIVLELTDDSPEGKLLGIQVDMHY